jgi:hypothetical protein
MARGKAVTDLERFKLIVDNSPSSMLGGVASRLCWEEGPIGVEGTGATVVRVTTKLAVGDVTREFPHVALAFDEEGRLVHAYGIEDERT